MKRSKFYIKTGTLHIALITLCVCVFSSCLKDKPPGDENYSHSSALVGFQYSGFSAVPITAGILGHADDSSSIEVTLSVASITLKSPVSLTIAASPASLDSFNTAQLALSPPGDVYTELDPSLYTLQNGGKLTINPGQQIVKFMIHYVGDQIDFSKNPAIPLKITDAQGATVAANLNTAIVLVKKENLYDGVYDLTITLTGWSAYGIADGPTNDYGSMGFVTTGDNTNVFDLGSQPGFTSSNGLTSFGATDPEFTFDPATNHLVAVTNLSPDDGRGRKFRINPDLPSGYDPATKTITLNYIMSQNGRPDQYITEVMTYQHPR